MKINTIIKTAFIILETISLQAANAIDAEFEGSLSKVQKKGMEYKAKYQECQGLEKQVKDFKLLLEENTERINSHAIENGKLTAAIADYEKQVKDCESLFEKQRTDHDTDIEKLNVAIAAHEKQTKDCESLLEKQRTDHAKDIEKLNAAIAAHKKQAIVAHISICLLACILVIPFCKVFVGKIWQSLHGSIKFWGKITRKRGNIIELLT